MDVEAHFSEIHTVIARELSAAQSEVVAAVAWLTNSALFEPLVLQARRGCRVRLALLDDNINRSSGIAFARLQAAGGEINWIPEAGRGGGSLHHKFCAIDGHTLITGSYNWTRRAARADENILLVRGDRALVAGYLDSFEQLLEKHGQAPRQARLDTQQLLRRIEIVRQLLLLGDYEALPQQLEHLERAGALARVSAVLDLLHARRWDAALEEVEALLSRGMAVTVYEDPVIAALQLEIRLLQAQVLALSNEQADLERTIQDFAHHRHQEIGRVLEDCLALRQEYWRLRAEQEKRQARRAAEEHYHKAREEYEAYREGKEELDRAATPVLSSEDRQELKRLYRECAMRCHPDRVGEADKAEAQALFVRVRAAYRQGSLDELRVLHRQLMESGLFAQPSAAPSEVSELRQRLATLRAEVEQLTRAIMKLRQSETYQTLSAITDWDRYFDDARQRLEKECESLQASIEELRHDH